MITAQSVLDYRDQLLQTRGDIRHEYTKEIYLNDSILHAATVMQALMQKAKDEPAHTLHMYCGEFSLFRDKTEQKINMAKQQCSREGLAPERVADWEGLDIFRDLQRDLEAFLQSGVKYR